LANDLASLLIARSIQACGACTATVLSRAIARDLFDGQALAKVMALTTVATAAAPGLSPLLGSALDHFFGWRSEFVFVAFFALCALLAYAALIGETNWSGSGSVNPVAVGASYLGLIRDARFVVPGRTAGLLIAGLFAIFGGLRVLLEHFGFSPFTLGLLFAAVVVVVFTSMLAQVIGTPRFLPRHAVVWALRPSEASRFCWLCSSRITRFRRFSLP
jgi:DHA1 family bicyclomycin/chloramphenicol resistance-like MFS transporter